MITKNTVKPIAYKDHRTLDFHRTFGSFSLPYAGPDFNFDTLQLRPDQRADGLPEACTAFTNNDIASNEDKVVYDDYDWTYRNTLMMMNAPYGSPCDVMKALESTTVYGVKSKVMTPEQASKRGPYFIVLKTSDYFEGLISAMLIKQNCLSCATPWFPEFEAENPGGISDSPANWKDLARATFHDWEACGIHTLSTGERRIIAKSWQGPNYGDKGYNYFSREQINALLATSGAGCFGQAHVQPGDAVRVEMDFIDVIISYMYMLFNKLYGTIRNIKRPASV